MRLRKEDPELEVISYISLRPVSYKRACLKTDKNLPNLSLGKGRIFELLVILNE